MIAARPPAPARATIPLPDVGAAKARVYQEARWRLLEALVRHNRAPRESIFGLSLLCGAAWPYPIPDWTLSPALHKVALAKVEEVAAQVNLIEFIKSTGSPLEVDGISYQLGLSEELRETKVEEGGLA